MNIRGKILVLIILVSVVSITALGLVVYNLGRAALEQESFNKLTAVRGVSGGDVANRKRFRRYGNRSADGG
jgi:hypothetical protein